MLAAEEQRKSHEAAFVRKEVQAKQLEKQQKQRLEQLEQDFRHSEAEVLKAKEALSLAQQEKLKFVSEQSSLA